MSRRPRAGRVLVALLGLGAVLAATVLQPWDAPVEPLLGRMDVSTGVSATGPPPSGLRVDWEVPRPPSVEDLHRGEWASQWMGAPVADGDLVRVGGNVVDTTTGDLVRVDRALHHDGQPVTTVVDAGELLVVDTLTGAVLHRAPAPAAGLPWDGWGARRSAGVTFLSDDDGSVLVRDDGSVVVELDQWMAGWLDSAWADPAVYPVRTLEMGDGWGWEDTAELRSPLSLIDAMTGGERVAFPGDRVRVADVMGDLALVASTDALPDERADGLRQPVAWSLQLHDGATGAQLHQFDVAATAAPRLLGRLGDETWVIAVANNGSLDLLGVTRDGAVRTVLHTDRVGRLDEGIGSLPVAAVTDDVLVVAEVDRLVAHSPDGQLRWEATPAPLALRSAGRHVVTTDDTGAVRVRRASDGEVVASLPSVLGPWGESTAGVPVAALDGHVGIVHDSADDVGLRRMSWLDLRTGRTRTSDHVVDRFLPPDAPAHGSWLFLGTVARGDGAVEPLLGHVVDGGFEVLDGRSGIGHHPLPVDGIAGTSEDDTWSTVSSVGGTVERLVLTSERDRLFPWSSPWEPERTYATHLVDRVSGDVTTVPDVAGLVLAGDVVVGELHENDDRPGEVVGLDVTTGAVRWSMPHRLTSMEDSALVADDDLVVHADLTHVTALSTRDGTVRWRHESDEQLSGELVLGPEQVATATTRGEVLALARQDGTIRWRTPVGAPVAGLSGAGDHVLVGTYDGAVVQLDGSGREAQRIVVGDGPVHDVAALGTTVVATTPDAVVGLRPDTGDLPHRDEVDLGLGRR